MLDKILNTSKILENSTVFLRYSAFDGLKCCLKFRTACTILASMIVRQANKIFLIARDSASDIYINKCNSAITYIYSTYIQSYFELNI